MNVADNIKKLKGELPKDCTLVAVSKTKSNEEIIDGYSSGHRDFGENKVQELVSKYDALPKDIRWHMIGHLQRNKVKYIAPFVHLIHGVDTLKLLREINKQAIKHDRQINCLLQIHIASEESKFGFSPTELQELVGNSDLSDLKNVQICGLMGMATNTENNEQVHSEFNRLRTLFEEIKSTAVQSNLKMEYLSMGMSSDYPIALENGANMIRVGSLLFGERNYA